MSETGFQKLISSEYPKLTPEVCELLLELFPPPVELGYYTRLMPMNGWYELHIAWGRVLVVLPDRWRVDALTSSPTRAATAARIRRHTGGLVRLIVSRAGLLWREGESLYRVTLPAEFDFEGRPMTPLRPYGPRPGSARVRSVEAVIGRNLLRELTPPNRGLTTDELIDLYRVLYGREPHARYQYVIWAVESRLGRIAIEQGKERARTLAYIALTL